MFPEGQGKQFRETEPVASPNDDALRARLANVGSRELFGDPLRPRSGTRRRKLRLDTAAGAEDAHQGAISGCELSRPSQRVRFGLEALGLAVARDANDPRAVVRSDFVHEGLGHLTRR